MANPNPSPATRVTNGEQLCDPEDRLTPLAQIKRMQRVLYKMTQKENVDAREAAQVALAWERLETRKNVLCMRPAPKPIDVTDRQAKRKPVKIVPMDMPREPGTVEPGV